MSDTTSTDVAPTLVVPPTPETVSLGNAVVGLVLAVVNLVGYVQSWAPHSFALANAAVGAFGAVITVLIRQKVTPMAKIRELAKVIPELASAFKLGEPE
jgi:hypothetical protein